MNNGDLTRSPSAWRGIKYFLGCNLKKRPYLVNLELTKRCNAKCAFCACWQEEKQEELEDFAPVVKKLRPLVLSISGGEPLIKKGWDEILKGMRPYCHYMVMITNGAILTEKVADKLSEVGLNQLAISLDYLDETHDEIRQIPGLYKKICDIVPKLTAKGYKILLNSVIMESNLDHIIPLAHTAKSWGAKISYSSYCALKRDDKDKMVSEEKLQKLEHIVSELKRLKKTLGNIGNSDYYLDGIPKYFKQGGMGNCRAGKNWVQVNPDGNIQPCTEMPKICNFKDYSRKGVPDITCTECWYACRGEAEAPHLTPDRLLELIRS